MDSIKVERAARWLYTQYSDDGGRGWEKLHHLTRSDWWNDAISLFEAVDNADWGDVT